MTSIDKRKCRMINTVSK